MLHVFTMNTSHGGWIYSMDVNRDLFVHYMLQQSGIKLRQLQDSLLCHHIMVAIQFIHAISQDILK